jgi:hypothetical protein
VIRSGSRAQQAKWRIRGGDKKQRVRIDTHTRAPLLTAMAARRALQEARILLSAILDAPAAAHGHSWQPHLALASGWQGAPAGRGSGSDSLERHLAAAASQGRPPLFFAAAALSPEAGGRRRGGGGVGAGDDAAALEQALDVLHQTADQQPTGQTVKTAGRPDVSAATQLLTRQIQRLTYAQLLRAVAAAARLADGGVASQSSSTNTTTTTSALSALLDAAAEQRLAPLTAPQVAALAAVWPCSNAQSGTQSAATATSSSRERVLAQLEWSLRQRQPPGSWDAAAVAALAAALQRHAVPAASGAYLSLAMLTVDVASRHRAPPQQQQLQQEDEQVPQQLQEQEGKGAAAEGAPPAWAFAPDQLLATARSFVAAGQYNQAAFDVLCGDALAQLRAAGLKLAPPNGSQQQHQSGEQQQQQQQQQQLFSAAQLAALVGACASARHFDSRLLQAAADALSRCRHDVGLEQLVEVRGEAAKHAHHLSLYL